VTIHFINGFLAINFLGVIVNLLRNSLLLFITIFVYWIVLTTANAQNENRFQQVTLSPSYITINQTEPFSIAMVYSVTTYDNTLLGLGIRIHYNSSCLQFIKAENYSENLFRNIAIQDDDQNTDNDTSTDRFILIAWFEWNSRWPGKQLPYILGKIYFQAIESLKPQKTPIHISFTAHHPGYQVKGISTLIDIK